MAANSGAAWSVGARVEKGTLAETPEAGLRVVLRRGTQAIMIPKVEIRIQGEC
jgi:hypothetical protein